MRNKKVKIKDTPNTIHSIDNFDIGELLNFDNEIQKDPDAEDLETQERKRYAQDTTYRKHLAIWVMFVVSIWLLTVLCAVFLTGLTILTLTSTVLCTLLATTTINVLGLAYIVLRGIFFGHDKHQSRKVNRYNQPPF